MFRMHHERARFCEYPITRFLPSNSPLYIRCPFPKEQAQFWDTLLTHIKAETNLLCPKKLNMGPPNLAKRTENTSEKAQCGSSLPPCPEACTHHLHVLHG